MRRLPRPRAAAAAAPLVLTALSLAGVQWALLHQLAEPPLYSAYLYGPVGLLYVGAGAVAMARRPTNRLGIILALAGLVTVVTGFLPVGVSGLTEVAIVLVTLPLGIIVHALHAFPSGRLMARPERVVVALTYLVTGVVVAPYAYLLVGPPGSGPLRLADDPDVAQVISDVNGILYSLLCLASAIILARRLVVLRPSRRRATLPLYACGIGALLAFPFAPNVLPELVPGVAFSTIESIQLVAAGLVPVAFAATLVRGGYARAPSAEELTTRLGDGATQEALALALGDASVRLHAVAPAAVPRDRGLLRLQVDGRPLGAIEYDATQLTDPVALQAAGTLAAVSAERARLLGELQGASEQMVRAADRERARIARDLHDGLQARLVLLALQADGEDAALRDGLTAALDDLRAFVQGVMPAGLIERGLEAALEDLADRVPLAGEVSIDLAERPLPPAVESTAYFVVAEALANAVKHAGASRVDVDVRREDETLRLRVSDDGRGGAEPGTAGNGLDGLADRLRALGGRLELDSPRGGGTRVVAEVPCAS